MNCKNCGFPLTKDNKTCPSCGENNEAYVAPKQEEIVSSNIQEMPKETKTSLDELVKPTNATPVTYTYEEPKKKNLKWIIIIVVALILIGVGVFVGIKFFTGEQTEPTPTVTPAVTPSKPTNTDKPTNNSKIKVYTVFDDMKASEIVENIKKIADISNGDVAYDYTDRFVFNGDDHILLKKEHTFGDDPQWSFYITSGEGYITQVIFKNVIEDKDGKISIEENAYLDLYFNVSDKDLSLEVYNKLRDMYSKLGTITNEAEHQKGKTTELEYNRVHYMLGIYEYNDEYQIHVQIPISKGE